MLQQGRAGGATQPALIGSLRYAGWLPQEKFPHDSKQLPPSTGAGHSPEGGAA